MLIRIFKICDHVDYAQYNERCPAIYTIYISVKNINGITFKLQIRELIFE